MKVIDFIFAARPMLHLPVWSIYLISYHYCHRSESLSLEGLIILAAASLMFAGTYYINQIYDFQSDLVNEKLGFLQREMISRSEMFVMYTAVSLISLATAYYLDFSIGFVFAGIFFLGLIYSAPPLRLKDRPMMGLLSNGVAYGILVPLTVPDLAKNIDYSIVSLPICLFLMVSAGYLLTTIPDREGDLKAGKKTLATYLSDRGIIVLGCVILLLSILIGSELNHTYLIIIAAISFVLFVAALLITGRKMILFACKLPIFLMSLLAGFYYPGYLVFLLALIFLTRLYYKKRFNLTYPELS